MCIRTITQCYQHKNIHKNAHKHTSSLDRASTRSPLTTKFSTVSCSARSFCKNTTFACLASRVLCSVPCTRCDVLQCVAVCCGVLRCVAVCCSVLQCVVTCRRCPCSANSGALSACSSAWLSAMRCSSCRRSPVRARLCVTPVKCVYVCVCTFIHIQLLHAQV